MTYVVGLTGGIGSGKSAVAAEFTLRGAGVVDANAISHQLSRRGEPGYVEIVRAFGTACLAEDGELDRTWLRRQAFASAEQRERLERALHPLIGARMLDMLAALDTPYAVAVVPLLLERGGLSAHVARVLVVDCPPEEQVRRVVRRSGLTEDEVLRIMATQVSRAERLARADDVIDNSGPPERLDPQVDALDRRYRELGHAAQATAGA